jgi:hypothetical protein
LQRAITAYRPPGHRARRQRNRGDVDFGAAFFGNYYLMDYELMGGDGRAAIIDETKKRSMTSFLPPAVAFGSHQWPALITPGSGPASLPICPEHGSEKTMLRS